VLQQVAAVTLPPRTGPGGPQRAAGEGRGGPANAAGPASAAPPAGVATARAGPEGPPEGWRIAFVSEAAAAAAHTSSSGQAEHPGRTARSLPLAMALQPGEAGSLFLELLAPPSGAPLPPGRHATPPPASGLATPGGTASGARASTDGTVVAAVQGLALAEEGPGGRGAGGVEGVDGGLQRLRLDGAGILAHFYRHARRGPLLTAVQPAAAAAAGAAPQQGTGGPAGAAGQGPAPGLPAPPPGASRGPGPAPGAGGGPPTPSLLPSTSLARGSLPLGVAPGGQPLAGPAPPGQLGLPGPAAVGAGPHAAAAAGPAAAPPAPAQARPPLMLPLADPPLDLLLLWAVSHGVHATHGPQRLGLCR
jgi:hypothetical protein